MIDKVPSLGGLSPLKSATPLAPKDAPAALPQDGWVGGVSQPPSASPPPSAPQLPDSRLEQHQEQGRSSGTTLALALAGLAVVGAGLIPQVAQAQVRTPAASSSLLDQVRSGQTVHAQNVQDVVRQFSAQRQLYVVGVPQYQGQAFDASTYRQLQEILKEHPHAYVVLVAQSGDVKGDDMTLSRGIGNHPEFTSLVDQETGQRNGSVFMIYFKVTDQKFIQQTGKDRAIYMRSEQLLDDAGVGENNFVDRETHEPRELMQTYVDSIRSGQGVPQALDAVLNKIDAGVSRHLSQSVRGARTAVQSADEMLDTVLDQVKGFQRQHGSKGSLGQPPSEAWKSSLKEAESALRARDYGRASQLASSLKQQLTQYQSQLSQFSQGPEQAQALRDQIQQLERQLQELQDNGQRQQAQQRLQQAQSSLDRYQERYDANELDFQSHLDAAKGSLGQARSSIEASRSAATAARNLKLVGGSALGVALVVTGILTNMRARSRRDEAQKKLDETLEVMGDRSRQLIEIMNQADVQQIAAFSGSTQKLAQELLQNTAEALALMGGGEKVLGQARDLIRGTGAGQRLSNWFTTGSFDRALELLTDRDKKMPFELADSRQLNLESGSRAEAWREHLLKTVTDKAGQESLLQGLDRLEQLARSNRNNTEVLLKESREVGSYLDAVKADAEKSQQGSLELQKSGEADGFFTAPSVSKRLLAEVLGERGLIARGHEIKGTDPFRARQEFGQVSERMIDDADAIVAVGSYGRASTLPALGRADAALHPHEIQTEWAHSKKEQLSLALDRSGEKALQATVQSSVQQLKSELVALEQRLDQVIALDKQRWEVAAPQIQEAEQAVARAREGLCTALQAAGVFAQGTPDQVLREPDRDPNAPLYEARQNYVALQPLLSEGNVEAPPGHLQKIASYTGQAHQLVEASREAFEAYPSSSGERRARRQDISQSIGQTYEPSKQRIEAGYSESAQRSVVGEVSHSTTSKVERIGDFLESTHRLLDRSASIQDQAQYNYERAHLLTARDQLEDIHALLVNAQSNLDAITRAEGLLGQHQATAEKELSSLRTRLDQTTKNSQAVYVRKQAKKLLAEVEVELEKARPVVFQKPASPYEAQATLAQVEKLRRQVESTIDADHRIYDEANQAMAQARSLIATTRGEIEAAGRTGWSQAISGFGTVEHKVDPRSLQQASSWSQQAQQEVDRADAQMKPQEYEQAKALGEQSQATSQQARQEVQRVLKAAEAVFQQKVAAGQAIAQAGREIEEAERQLDSAARQSWSQYVSDFGQVAHSVSYHDLSRARSSLEQSRQELQSARSAMNSGDYDRARNQAREATETSNQAVAEAERAVQAQHQVYLQMVREAQECAEAKQLIRQAESAIQRADSEVSSASRQSWSQHVSNYGTVSHSVSSSDLSSAYSYLNSARSDLSQASSYLSSRNYSSAQSEARSAASSAERAEREAESVVSREHDEFRRKVREAENQANPPGGGGSGGGSGGSGGGSGGGVGGGGSGSTGGGW